jgi:hypothetical protein
VRFAKIRAVPTIFIQGRKLKLSRIFCIFCPIWITFGAEHILKMFKECGLLRDWLGPVKVTLHSGKYIELYPYLPHFLSELGEIWHKSSAHNAA